jgi:hypothetical protein
MLRVLKNYRKKKELESKEEVKEEEVVVVDEAKNRKDFLTALTIKNNKYKYLVEQSPYYDTIYKLAVTKKWSVSLDYCKGYEAFEKNITKEKFNEIYTTFIQNPNTINIPWSIREKLNNIHEKTKPTNITSEDDEEILLNDAKKACKEAYFELLEIVINPRLGSLTENDLTDSKEKIESAEKKGQSLPSLWRKKSNSVSKNEAKRQSKKDEKDEPIKSEKDKKKFFTVGRKAKPPVQEVEQKRSTYNPFKQ